MTQLSALDAPDERKRLGQYFTGERLASLLAHLALADSASSVIDPMAGRGDMLAAAHSAGAVGALFGAVEIDPAAGQMCADRLDSLNLAEAHICIGDAFTRETWGSLADRTWELVITNPPYVRYQRSAAPSHGRVSLPDARRIREGLINFIEQRRLLSPADRHAMRVLAEGYSGLADLAVPSWLLCASLVDVGGRLAMVVPDTWLSRDYARPVLYLLRRFFDLEVVVEDADAVWFEDALVRTNLVIARRVEDRGTGLDVDTPQYIRVKLDKTTIDDVSIVGALLPDSPSPDRAFAEIVRGLSSRHGDRQLDGFSMSLANDDDVRGLLEGALNSRWLRAVEPTPRTLRRPQSGSSVRVYVPPPVAAVLGAPSDDWQSLAAYGWSVGQGLRTGANRFFYGQLLESDESSALLAVDSSISREPLEVPLSVLRPVVRRQEDLDGQFVVGHNTSGRVIALQDHALPEDIAETTALLGACPYKEIPEPLASYVRRASITNVSSNGRPKLIPTLSAVATNVRRAQVDRPNLPPRFWYQLPEFAPRHAPALLMPRVNHAHPRAFANPDRVLVDANFSALWPQDQTTLPVWAVLALLNSTWVSVVLENAATILGGGALKVEATHLRRLPLPNLESQYVRLLAELGSKLADASTDVWDDLLNEIDTIVWDRALGGSEKAACAAEALSKLNEATAAQRGWAHRSPDSPTHN